MTIFINLEHCLKPTNSHSNRRCRANTQPLEESSRHITRVRVRHGSANCGHQRDDSSDHKNQSSSINVAQ